MRIEGRENIRRAPFHRRASNGCRVRRELTEVKAKTCSGALSFGDRVVQEGWGIWLKPVVFFLSEQARAILVF